MQPYQLAKDQTGTINITAVSVLERKHPHENISSCATLETYKETPIFIPVENKEEAIKLAVEKRPGASGPGVTDLEALQGRILKSVEDRKILCTSVTIFVNWLANGILP